MAVPEKYMEALERIQAAANAGVLAALETVEKATGEPAYLLVAVQELDDGHQILPLGRLDVDFMADFEPPGEEEEGESSADFACGHPRNGDDICPNGCEDDESLYPGRDS